MNSYTDDTVEIDLKELVLALALKWKKIIAITLLFTLAGGLWGAFCCTLKDEDGVAFKSDKLVELEESLFEQKKLIQEAEINAKYNKDRISTLKEYSEKSIFFSLDPNHIPTCRVQYYVVSDMKLSNKRNDVDAALQSILYEDPCPSAYITMLSDMAFIEALSETVGIESKYLKELISCGANSGIISIKAYGRTEAEAETIINAIIKAIPNITKDVTNAVEDHVCNYIGKTLFESASSSIESKVHETNLAIVAAEDAYNTNLLNVEVAKKEIAKLEPQIASAKSKFNGLLKKVVILGLIGFVLECAVVVCKFLFGNKVNTLYDLKRCGKANILLVTPSMGSKKYDFIQKRVLKLCGHKIGPRTQDDVKILAKTVAMYLTPGDRVLVCSDVDNKERKNLELGILTEMNGSTGASVYSGGNILTDFDTFEKLSECSNVVLGVQLGHSKMSNVRDAIEKIESMNKPLLGIVVIDM